MDSRNNSSSPQPSIVFKRANLQIVIVIIHLHTHCHFHCINQLFTEIVFSDSDVNLYGLGGALALVGIMSGMVHLVESSLKCRSIVPSAQESTWSPLPNTNRSKRVEWTLGTTRQVLNRTLFSSGQTCRLTWSHSSPHEAGV